MASSDFTNLRKESFAIESNMLVRRVVPWRGKPYEHRCDQAAFEEIAHTIDELGGEPFGLEDLQQRTRLPWTRIATALAFLKERTCIVPVHGRKHVAATDAVHLDAMTEWHALREKPGS